MVLPSLGGKEVSVMKKFAIREAETVKTTAAAYPIWLCWPF